MKKSIENLERNKLIADFMGLIFYDLELKYNKSWDWLMPVVEKCYQCNHEEGDLHMRLNDAVLTVNIEAVYKAVVEFIHWHNYEESKKRLESHKCDIISRIVDENYGEKNMNVEDVVAYLDKHDYLVHRSIQLGLNPFDTIDMIDRLTNKDK